MKKLYLSNIIFTFLTISNLIGMENKKTITTTTDNMLIITTPNIYNGPKYKKALNDFYYFFGINPQKGVLYESTFDEETRLEAYIKFINIHVAIVQDAFEAYKSQKTNQNKIDFEKAFNNFELITNNLKNCLIEHVHNYITAWLHKIKNDLYFYFGYSLKAFAANQIAQQLESKLPLSVRIKEFNYSYIKIKQQQNKQLTATLTHNTDQSNYFVPLKSTNRSSKYNDMNLAESYLRQHIEQKIYLCILCNKTMNDRSNAQRHVRSVHLNSEKNKKRKRDSITPHRK